MLGSIDQARRVLEDQPIDEVLICLPIKSRYDTITELIDHCEELGITARVSADFFQTRHGPGIIDCIEDLPLMTFGMMTSTAIGSATKRAVDLIASSFALVVLCPIAVLCALAIKLDSPGPVHFVQERVGLKRRRFKLIKFRTMHVNAEKALKEIEDRNEVAGAAFKIADDPRVTRVGRMLRKTSLDELPQFWNVLAGDMSLVGPRPLPVRDVERFDHDWQFRRFSVKPGVTCLWQVHGRHEIDFDNWICLLYTSDAADDLLQV